MADRYPSHAVPPPAAGVAFQMASVPRRTVATLRSWNPAHAHGDIPLTFVGQRLPSEVGRAHLLTVAASPCRLLCVGPAEWLVTSPVPVSWREAGAASLGLTLLDLSDGTTCLALRGSAVREVLSEACGLDFHPSVFAQDCCARTRFAHVATVIDCVAPEEFHLYVGRSYRHYLETWLAGAYVGT